MTWSEGLLADAGKKLPFVDRIIWKEIEEDQPRWLLFLQGRIDVSGIPKDNFNQTIDPRGDLDGGYEKTKYAFAGFSRPQHILARL